MERDGLDAVIVSGSEYTGFEGVGHLDVGVRDRPPLRLRAAPARGRPDDRVPARGHVRRRARDDVDRGERLRRPPGRVARRQGARPEGRRLRARLRDDRSRLPVARRRGRARELGRRLRPRPRREERLRDRLGQGERPRQHRGLLGLPRELRAREERAGDPRRVRALLRRGGLRPADDGHGAHRPERRRPAGVQDRRPAPHRRRRDGAALARGRGPRRPLGRGERARSAPASRATRRSR